MYSRRIIISNTITSVNPFYTFNVLKWETVLFILALLSMLVLILCSAILSSRTSSNKTCLSPPWSFGSLLYPTSETSCYILCWNVRVMVPTFKRHVVGNPFEIPDAGLFVSRKLSFMHSTPSSLLRLVEVLAFDQ